MRIQPQLELDKVMMVLVMMVLMMVMGMMMTMVVMTMVMMVVTTMMMAVVVSMAGGPNPQGSNLWDFALMAILSNDARNVAPRL